MNKLKKAKLVLIISSAILSLICLFVCYSLNIVEMKDATFYNYTKLKYIIVLINVAITFAIFTVASMIFFIINRNKSNSKSGKIFFILMSLLLVAGVFVSVVVPANSASETNITSDWDSNSDYEKIDPKYENLFPFYKDFQKLSDGQNLSDFGYSKTEIQNNKYVHINNCLMNDESLTYDVQYFASNSSFIMSLYNSNINAKSDFYKDKKCSTATYNSITYNIYKNNDYFELRILNKNEVFIMFLNSYKDYASYDDSQLIKIAFEQYETLKG